MALVLGFHNGDSRACRLLKLIHNTEEEHGGNTILRRIILERSNRKIYQGARLLCVHRYDRPFSMKDLPPLCPSRDASKSDLASH